MIKLWPSRTPGKGVCGGAKNFGSALLQPARSGCVSSGCFIHFRLWLLPLHLCEDMKVIALAVFVINFSFSAAPCGLQGCKNRPAPFPGRMSYKATKPGLVSVLYLSMHYTVLLFIRAPFYVLLVFIAICSVFWLFWLSYQYLPCDWLERLVCVPILLCFLG